MDAARDKWVLETQSKTVPSAKNQTWRHNAWCLSGRFVTYISTRLLLIWWKRIVLGARHSKLFIYRMQLVFLQGCQGLSWNGSFSLTDLSLVYIYFDRFVECFWPTFKLRDTAYDEYNWVSIESRAVYLWPHNLPLLIFHYRKKEGFFSQNVGARALLQAHGN